MKRYIVLVLLVVCAAVGLVKYSTAQFPGSPYGGRPPGAGPGVETDPIVGAVNGIVEANGAGAIGAATQGVDYYAPGGVDVAVVDGGTGSSNAAGARTNLGLVIGVNVLAPNGSGAALTGIPLDADFGANGVMERTGAGTYGIATEGTDYYAPGGTDVAVADGGTGSGTAGGARTNLGLIIGTDVLAPNGSGAALTGIPLDSDFGSNGIMKRTAAGVYGIATPNTDYEPALTDAASLYASLTDVAQFYEPQDVALLAKNVIASAGNISVSVAQMNSVIFMTAAGEVVVPDVCDSATGHQLKVMNKTATNQVELAVADTGNDKFVLIDGTALDVDDEVDLDTAASSWVFVVCLETNTWYITSQVGVATDGGVAD